VRTRSLLLVGVAAIIFAGALPAKACSCFQGDPRDALAEADAAFIGTLLSRTPDPDNQYLSTYTFSVEEEIKGQLDDTVPVRSATDGASCGIEVPVGGQTGLFLTASEEGWSSSLCQQIAPDDLRAAAQPLPAPDGEGPIRMLVSGSLGEVGIIALDDQGRTLAYGMRQPDSGTIEMCPGSQRFIEIFGDFRRRNIAVRETSTLEVLREIELPIGRRPYRNVFATAMACFNESGRVIYLAAQRFGDGGEDYIFRIRGDEIRRIYRGHFGTARFEGKSLFITEGKRSRFLVELDFGDPHRDGIATVPGSSRSPHLSPDGEWIVMTAGGDVGKLVVVNRSTGKVRVKRLGIGQAGEAMWLINRRIAFLAGGYDNARIEIFSRRLERLRQVPGEWYTSDNFISGSTAIGVGWGTLYRSELPEGPTEILRRFDSPTIYSITPVLDEVHAAPAT